MGGAAEKWTEVIGKFGRVGGEGGRLRDLDEFLGGLKELVCGLVQFLRGFGGPLCDFSEFLCDFSGFLCDFSDFLGGFSEFLSGLSGPFGRSGEFLGGLSDSRGGWGDFLRGLEIRISRLGGGARGFGASFLDFHDFRAEFAVAETQPAAFAVHWSECFLFDQQLKVAPRDPPIQLTAERAIEISMVEDLRERFEDLFDLFDHAPNPASLGGLRGGGRLRREARRGGIGAEEPGRRQSKSFELGHQRNAPRAGSEPHQIERPDLCLPRRLDEGERCLVLLIELAPTLLVVLLGHHSPGIAA